MKTMLLLAALAVAGLSGCSTYRGGTNPDANSGVVYGTEVGTAIGTTSDFGRGEGWRNTPNAMRDQGTAPPLPTSVLHDERPTGGYQN